jgi:hypothetical protein
MDGVPISTIADMFGITKGRISQILSAYALDRPYVDGSFVYFYRVGDYIKIGVSRNLRQRCKAFQMLIPFDGSLIGAFPGSQEDEADVHRQFKRFEHRNEWFHAVPELLEWVETHAKPFMPDL